ncbi:MAG: preprotein translocase subunit SecE [Desulfobulbia bacterium]
MALADLHPIVCKNDQPVQEETIIMASKEDRLAKSKKAVGNEPEQESVFRPGRVKEFATEVKNEFGKIVWPAKKQTVGTTAVVVVLVMIISFYLGAVDLLLGKIIGYVLR